MQRELRPAWLNPIQYPFTPREFPTREGWMSYVDVGAGRPIVFVHGSMSWSYIFRRQIRALLPFHRCIAPDHLGFGLSEKPAKAPYKHEDHARRFRLLMDYLDVEDVTLAVHDSGGPIGLSWALDNPERVREIVYMNTFMWSQEENRNAYKMSRVVNNPFNRFYLKLLNATPAFILPGFFADRHRMTRPIQMHYLEPFRFYGDRDAVFAMISGWHKSNAWFESLWERREAIADKRALFMWGSKDPIFGLPTLERWQEFLPEAETVKFSNHGRYLLEESTNSVTEELRWFLMNYQRTLIC